MTDIIFFYFYELVNVILPFGVIKYWHCVIIDFLFVDGEKLIFYHLSKFLIKSVL